jgi:hypothetical protein
MYKEVTIFTLSSESGQTVKWMAKFQTQEDYNEWIKTHALEGFTIVNEECLVQPYPQVLKLDLKGERGGYYSTIQRFETSQEYTKYCDDRLMEGLKVIGSELYKNFNEQ